MQDWLCSPVVRIGEDPKEEIALNDLVSQNFGRQLEIGNWAIGNVTIGNAAIGNAVIGNAAIGNEANGTEG